MRTSRSQAPSAGKGRSSLCPYSACLALRMPPIPSPAFAREKLRRTAQDRAAPLAQAKSTPNSNRGLCGKEPSSFNGSQIKTRPRKIPNPDRVLGVACPSRGLATAGRAAGPFQFEFAGATNGDNFTQDAIQLFGLGIGSAGLGAGGHSPETAVQILCPFLRLPLLWPHQVAA